jgi:hypothetical protein
MKRDETKTKFAVTATKEILQPSCPACLSGIEPTVLKGDFDNALRESL